MRTHLSSTLNRTRLSVLVHPFKGFADFIEGNYYPKWGIALVMVLFFVSSITERQLTGFLFNHNNLKELNVIYLFAGTIVLFCLWVGCNWAITTLFDGKGTLKQIAFISAVSLIPHVISTYLRVLLSNLITPEEGVFLIIILVVGILHSCFILLVGLILIHDYTLQKVLWSSLFTILFIAVILFLVVILFSLFQQTYNFFRDVLNELYYMS